MRILLTGSTGLIGGSILKALASAGHEITCLVRSPSKALTLFPSLRNKISLIQLHPTNNIKNYYYTLAKGFPCIIHSGYYMSPSDAELETQVISGFIQAAKETSQTSNVKLIVTTGALCVGESFELAGEDQTSNSNAFDFAIPRVPHELMVINSNSESLKASIVRPTCVYEGSFVDSYYQACRRFGKIIAPTVNGTLSYIHKDDLGEFYRLLAESSECGYFNVSEGLGPDVDQVIEIAKSVTGVKVVERVDNVYGYLHLYGSYLLGLTLIMKLDSKRGRELLGFVPKHNFQLEGNKLLQVDRY